MTQLAKSLHRQKRERVIAVKMRVGSILTLFGVGFVTAFAILLKNPEPDWIKSTLLSAGLLSLMAGPFFIALAKTEAGEHRRRDDAFRAWSANDYLARWTYQDEWSRLKEHKIKEAELRTADNTRKVRLALWGFPLAGVLITLTMGIINGDWIMATILGGFVGLAGFLIMLWAGKGEQENDERARELLKTFPDTDPPDVIWGREGYSIGDSITTWDPWCRYTFHLTRDPLPGIVVTTYTARGGPIETHSTKDEYLVPIPEGKWDEAEFVVRELSP